MTGVMSSLRRYSSPVLARGAVLAVSVAASTLLIRVRGLPIFGLLATLLLLGRLGGALIPGDVQLAFARRSVAASTALRLRRYDVTRVVAACALTAVGALVAVDQFGASAADTVALVALAVLLAIVTALLRLSAIKQAQAGRTSLSAVCDISVVAPVAALTFLVSDLGVAAVLQILVLLALGVVCIRSLADGDTAESSTWSNTPRGDLVAFAVTVLPMMHGQVGPVLGLFGLEASAVGLLAFAQRLASFAPLILAGAGASVLAAAPGRARATTLKYAKWGGLAFAGFSVVVLAIWPAIRAVVDIDDVGIAVLALVLTANLINVGSGPVGQYAIVVGQQRLDLISLLAGVVALVPFVFLASTANEAAVAAVVVAAVRAVTLWALLIRAERNHRPVAAGSAATVGRIGVD